MKSHLEHLRKIQFVILTLCLISVGYMLQPQKNTFELARKEYESIKVISNNMNYLGDALFNQEAKELFDSYTKLFLDTLPSMLQVVEIGDTQGMVPPYLIVPMDNCHVELQYIDCSNLFYPDYSVHERTRLDQFIATFDAAFEEKQFAIPAKLASSKAYLENRYFETEKNRYSLIETISSSLRNFLKHALLLEDEELEYLDDKNDLRESLQKRYCGESNSIEGCSHNIEQEIQKVEQDLLYTQITLNRSKLHLTNEPIWTSPTIQSSEPHLTLSYFNTSAFVNKFGANSNDPGRELNRMIDGEYLQKALIPIDDVYKIDKSIDEFIETVNDIFLLHPHIDERYKPRLGLSFDKAFPNFSLIFKGRSGIVVSDRNEVNRLFEELMPLYQNSISVFGTTINWRYAGLLLSCLLVLAVGYFLVHYRELSIKRKANDALLDNVPWIGIYSSKMAKIAFLAILTILPVLCSWFLWMSMKDSLYYKIGLVNVGLLTLMAYLNLKEFQNQSHSAGTLKIKSRINN